MDEVARGQGRGQRDIGVVDVAMDPKNPDWCSTPRRTTRCASRGRSPKADRAAASTRRSTPARPGRSSAADCRSALLGRIGLVGRATGSEHGLRGHRERRPAGRCDSASDSRRASARRAAVAAQLYPIGRRRQDVAAGGPGAASSNACPGGRWCWRRRRRSGRTRRRRWRPRRLRRRQSRATTTARCASIRTTRNTSTC